MAVEELWGETRRQYEQKQICCRWNNQVVMDSFFFFFLVQKTNQNVTRMLNFQDSYNLLQFAHNLKMSTTAHQKITKLNTIRIYSPWEKKRNQPNYDCQS